MIGEMNSVTMVSRILSDDQSVAPTNKPTLSQSFARYVGAKDSKAEMSSVTFILNPCRIQEISLTRYKMRVAKNLLETSNPALRNHEAWNEALQAGGTQTASIGGVVNKTGMLTCVAVGGGMFGIWLTQNYPGLALPLGIVGFIATFVVYFIIMRNPARAKYTAWMLSLIHI